MSASTAISMVGESLKEFLEGEMQLVPSVDVTLLAPDESQANGRVNLFLYKVQESPYQRNMDWQVSPDDASQLRPPPLTLNLFYLMTPYAHNDPHTGNTNTHAILGEAMRVLHEIPVVPDTYLVTGLDGAREQIKVMPGVLDMEELTKIWSTFSQPFRLSVAYEVSVIQIDQSDDSNRIMATRVEHIGVPQVSAPFSPPIIHDINPKQGAAGISVTISGTGFDGWRAYVSITGIRIADALPITGDSFNVTIPGELQEGFHQLRIDVSHLARQTFFFEVTS